MKATVIIPTRNAGKHLERLFNALNGQSVRPVQIVVVDSSSTDDTRTVCKRFDADLIQIEAARFDHGGTRNLAASRAVGDVLVFITQDALPKDEECLEHLIKPLETPDIGASYGRQIPKLNANPIEVFTRSFNYPSAEVVKGIDDLSRFRIKTFFFSNACSAIRKRAYEEVGGFPERTIMNEDMFLAANLIMKGYKIAYQPSAVIYHSHDYSLKTQFRRHFDIGVFFKSNGWIKNLGNPEKEGIKFLKEEIRFLLSNGMARCIPYGLVDAAVRFLGYRTGLLEGRLPLIIKRKLSLNRLFWEMHSSSVEQGDFRC